MAFIDDDPLRTKAVYHDLIAHVISPVSAEKADAQVSIAFGFIHGGDYNEPRLHREMKRTAGRVFSCLAVQIYDYAWN